MVKHYDQTQNYSLGACNVTCNVTRCIVSIDYKATIESIKADPSLSKKEKRAAISELNSMVVRKTKESK